MGSAKHYFFVAAGESSSRNNILELLKEKGWAADSDYYEGLLGDDGCVLRFVNRKKLIDRSDLAELKNGCISVLLRHELLPVTLSVLVFKENCVVSFSHSNSGWKRLLPKQQSELRNVFSDVACSCGVSVVIVVDDPPDDVFSWLYVSEGQVAIDFEANSAWQVDPVVVWLKGDVELLTGREIVNTGEKLGVYQVWSEGVVVLPKN